MDFDIPLSRLVDRDDADRVMDENDRFAEVYMRVPRVSVEVVAGVIALAQKKNLEAAGKELGVSSSAVYKRIQAANQIFGTRLFTSTNDGAELAETGAPDD
jgi:hypothetical protein